MTSATFGQNTENVPCDGRFGKDVAPVKYFHPKEEQSLQSQARRMEFQRWREQSLEEFEVLSA